jgi:glucose dehydrogenase
MMISGKPMRQALFALRRLTIALVVGMGAQHTVGSDESDFAAHCARCHAPEELRSLLTQKWSGRSAAELFSVVSTTMPAEVPGSLSSSQYLAITTYLLDLGGFPRPAGALSMEQLAAIQIVAPEPKDAVLPDVPWKHFGSELNANRYAALDDIHRDNVGSLEVAWRWSTANFGPTPERRNVSMPIMRHGKLYMGAGATRNVVALDASTGQILWLWRPREGVRFTQAARKDSGKGVSFWDGPGGRRRVITVTPGYQLVSLDADTGLPDPKFGENGWVDLQQGLRRAPGRELDIGLTAPPLVVGDTIIVGSAHRVSFRPPSKANVKGDVRAFDASSGQLLWTFHTIPEPGEEGYETWLDGSAGYTGNAGVWAPMSADPDLGLVYLPVESATGDRYGGDRPGANLFSSSLVAVDLKTGERRWHFQHAHHDIWDWDTPAAPILADLPDGRKVVAQLTKQAMVFVFDRVTGEPVWPIEERPVPQSDVPGEWTSPTQPFPRKPAPFDRQGVTEDDLIDYTPAIRTAVADFMRTVRLGEMYAPASLADASDGTAGTLTLPSPVGGANWEGGAYDPSSGLLYVPSMTLAVVLQLLHDPEASDVRFIAGKGRPPLLMGLPLIKPPWGRITAIDLVSGDHRFMIANSDTPPEVASNPALEGIVLPRTGKHTRAGILLTSSLLFAGEGFTRFGWNSKPVFRAHDKLTGEILAEIELPAAQVGPPSTYRVNGRQFIVMTIADGTSPAELIALALPADASD